VAAVATSVNHPDVPDTQFVRAHLYMGCFMLEKIDQVRTKVTYMVHVDIKGSIPKFIVNKVQNGQGKVVHLLAENLKS
jgi:pentose-5-phosphate-3-epimerase